MIIMTLQNVDEKSLVLVAGATGDLGGAVTQILLAQGKKVRVLIRPKSNYQPLIQAGAQPSFGDLKDRASLDEACKGVKILLTTANSAKRGGEDNPQTVDLEGNRKLIDAAKNAGVKQFIFVSLSIADPNSPIPFISAKGKTEEYLRASGIPFTIIAPNAFMEAWIALVVGVPALMGQPVTIVGEGRRKHSFISAVDVAKFMIASIENPKAINQKLVIGGPEALSLRDATSIFEQILKRSIPINSVVPGQPVPGLPGPMVGMLTSLDFFDSPIDMDDLSSTFGVKLTPMNDFAAAFIKNAKS
jgi:uncharacterized protein YbjT (DUF2867 family)